MPTPRQLVHTEWFDYALQQVGSLRRADALLAAELYRLACYADLVRLAPGCRELRLYQTREFLGSNGQIVRILIYFVLRSDDSVKLQHIEVVADDMGASER